MDLDKTTAKKAWASVSLFPLHINTMAVLCVAELRRGRGGSKKDDSKKGVGLC